jgi:hypothetical protein
MGDGRAAADSGRIGDRQCSKHRCQQLSLADRLHTAPHVLLSALKDAMIAMRLDQYRR